MKKKAKLLLYHLSKSGGARVFLGLRQVDYTENYWWLPGGSVEGNEKWIDAAIRELKEELIVDTVTQNTILSYLENNIYIPNIGYNTDTSENMIFFLDIGPIKEEPIPEIKEEFTSVQWFSIKDLPSNMSREYKLVNNFFSEKWLKSISQI